MPGIPILLVEDDEGIAASMIDLLVDEGYDIVHMPDGKSALAHLAAGYRPAAMIVDFGMPEMNGAEFVRACSADPELARIPTMVMSAYRPADLAAVGLGAYLQKPFDADDLVNQLARLVKSPG